MKTRNKILLSVGISTLLVYLAGAFINWNFNYIVSLDSIDRAAMVVAWILLNIMVIAIISATE